jgi:hypothetical protein
MFDRFAASDGEQPTAEMDESNKLVPHRRCRPAVHETGVLPLSFVLLNLHFCFFVA